MALDPNRPPKDDILRHLLIVGVLAVVFYFGGFYLIEHLRSTKGPWEILFTTDGAGHPTLEISQPKLQIAETVRFPNGNAGKTNVAELVRFREETTNLPFGEVLMQDALYLPGSVTLRLCGHVVEILPRTLIVDKQEHPWKAQGDLEIAGAP
jgi:hypothetical protein